MIWLVLAQLIVSIDPQKTPGLIRSELSTTEICETKWSLDRRHVTQGMKRDVAAAYGLEWEGIGKKVEFDHLVPRELGGADDARNLWPQPWPQARKKDRLENLLHRKVCAGELGLREAQRMIRSDWLKAYAIYFEK